MVEPEPAGVSCDNCHRTGLPAETWAWSTSTDDRGRSSVLCPDCAREHARSIEAKLADDWW